MCTEAAIVSKKSMSIDHYYVITHNQTIRSLLWMRESNSKESSLDAGQQNKLFSPDMIYIYIYMGKHIKYFAITCLLLSELSGCKVHH